MFRHIIHCSIFKNGNYFFFLTAGTSHFSFLKHLSFSFLPSKNTKSSSTPNIELKYSSFYDFLYSLVPGDRCFLLQSEDFRALCNHHSHCPYITWYSRMYIHASCRSSHEPETSTWSSLLYIFFIHSASQKIQHTDEANIYSDYWIIQFKSVHRNHVVIFPFSWQKIKSLSQSYAAQELSYVSEISQMISLTDWSQDKFQMTKSMMS